MRRSIINFTRRIIKPLFCAAFVSLVLYSITKITVTLYKEKTNQNFIEAVEKIKNGKTFGYCFPLTKKKNYFGEYKLKVQRCTKINDDLYEYSLQDYFQAGELAGNETSFGGPPGFFQDNAIAGQWQISEYDIHPDGVLYKHVIIPTKIYSHDPILSKEEIINILESEYRQWIEFCQVDTCNGNRIPDEEQAVFSYLDTEHPDRRINGLEQFYTTTHSSNILWNRGKNRDCGICIQDTYIPLSKQPEYFKTLNNLPSFVGGISLLYSLYLLILLYIANIVTRISKKIYKILFTIFVLNIIVISVVTIGEATDTRRSDRTKQLEAFDSDFKDLYTYLEYYAELLMKAKWEEFSLVKTTANMVYQKYGEEQVETERVMNLLWQLDEFNINQSDIMDVTDKFGAITGCSEPKVPSFDSNRRRAFILYDNILFRINYNVIGCKIDNIDYLNRYTIDKYEQDLQNTCTELKKQLYELHNKSNEFLIYDGIMGRIH